MATDRDVIAFDAGIEQELLGRLELAERAYRKAWAGLCDDPGMGEIVCNAYGRVLQKARKFDDLKQLDAQAKHLRTGWNVIVQNHLLPSGEWMNLGYMCRWAESRPYAAGQVVHMAARRRYKAEYLKRVANQWQSIGSMVRVIDELIELYVAYSQSECEAGLQGIRELAQTLLLGARLPFDVDLLPLFPGCNWRTRVQQPKRLVTPDMIWAVDASFRLEQLLRDRFSCLGEIVVTFRFDNNTAMTKTLHLNHWLKPVISTFELSDFEGALSRVLNELMEEVLHASPPHEALTELAFGLRDRLLDDPNYHPSILA